jgi:hypothetical protein
MRYVLLALLILSILGLSYYYNKAEKLQSRISEYEKNLEELKRNISEKEILLSDAESNAAALRKELSEAEEEIEKLREELKAKQDELSSCLSKETQPVEIKVENESVCERELASCRNELSSIRRARVYVVHWWYDSFGCVPCGTANVKFHIVLFNAGYETAEDVRVIITLYGESGPINVIRIDAGSLSGRTAKVLEQIVTISANFRRAEVSCES